MSRLPLLVFVSLSFFLSFSLLVSPSLCVSSYRLKGTLLPNTTLSSRFTIHELNSFRILLSSTCPLSTHPHSPSTGTPMGGLAPGGGEGGRCERVGIVGRDGGFVIRDVHEGEHLLQVVSPDYYFDLLRISVSAGLVKITRTDGLHALERLAKLEVMPRARVAYFVPRAGFDVRSLVMNPMVIMMGVTLVLTLCMGKMSAGMEGMQEELAAETGREVEKPVVWTPETLRIMK